MILALGLAACSKVQDLSPEITPEESQEKEEVKASVLTFQTVSVDTKTVLSGKSINWLATDVIKIFNADGESAEFTTSAEKISGTSATFSGTLEASSRYYALFPYDADATISEGKITTVVPYTVKAETAGSFDSSSNIAVATTTGTDLAFKNVLSYIKLDLSEESDVTEVMIRSKGDAAKYLSGKVEITVADVPTVNVVDGIPFVRLVPATGDATITPGIYYVPVIPATLSSGISVRVKKAGGLYLKESANALTAERNIPVALPKIATTGFEYYKEVTVCDGNGGFGPSSTNYREYGSTFAETDANLPNLGDNNKSTKWVLPGSALRSGYAGDAWYMDGTKTYRGPYLRLDFNNASRSNPTLIKPDALIFEYDAYGNSQYDPVTLRIQQYSTGKKSILGDVYGVLAELTQAADALPAQEAYKDCYVSDRIVRPVHPEKPYGYFILCCTKTAKCDDLITKFSAENKWGMSNLRVWIHENPSLSY